MHNLDARRILQRKIIRHYDDNLLLLFYLVNCNMREINQKSNIFYHGL